jgi:hypothetical protein
LLFKIQGDSAAAGALFAVESTYSKADLATVCLPCFFSENRFTLCPEALFCLPCFFSENRFTLCPEALYAVSIDAEMPCGC